MGYYIRVLGTVLDIPKVDELREAALPALVEVDEEPGSKWTELVLKHASGDEITIIERNETDEGLGADELHEFIEEVGGYRPANAAQWLKSYLPKVKVIYAFQLLGGTDVDDGWARLHAVQSFIWNRAKGILQSDGEGFTNEAGYTVLWQFSETADGLWNVAVLTGDGSWKSFEINLGDKAQREAFQRGEEASSA